MSPNVPHPSPESDSISLYMVSGVIDGDATFYLLAQGAVSYLSDVGELSNDGSVGNEIAEACDQLVRERLDKGASGTLETFGHLGRWAVQISEFTPRLQVAKPRHTYLITKIELTVR